MSRAKIGGRLTWRTLRQFHALLDFSRSQIFGVLILNVAILCCQLPTPFVVGSIINALGSGGNLLEVLPQVGLALGLMLGVLALSSCEQIVNSRQVLEFALTLRTRMFTDLVDEPSTSKQVELDISDLHSRFNIDVGALVLFWPTGIAAIFRHAITLGLSSAALLYISAPLTLCIAGFLPVAIFFFRRFSRRLSALASMAQASLSGANGILLESLNSAKLAQIHGTRAFHRERLGQALRASSNALHLARICSATMGFALGILPLMVSAVIWIVGGKMVHDSQLTAGNLVAFALILSILYSPINGLFSAASGAIFEWAALSRILEVLNTSSLPPINLNQRSAAHSTAVSIPSGCVSDMTLVNEVESIAYVAGGIEISLRGLSFSRGTHQLFEDLNLSIPAGSCASLGGRNGAGKSTLMSLIFGAEPALSHRIFLNGVPLSGFTPEGRSKIFGYLPQDVMLYTDTVRNNIAMGRDFSDDVIFALAHDLGISGFLQEWPLGLDTAIQEGGRNLSGGQKQRIALLRALIGWPLILLMDEPEQNLDLQALSGLISYLQCIKHRCTCIVVTHCDAFEQVMDLNINLNSATV